MTEQIGERMVRSYRDLEVWKKAMALVTECYRLSADFPKTEMYGLTSQLRRSAVSIPSNIAEGHARQYTQEFLHFLAVAQGSLAELETQLMLSERLHFTRSDQLQALLEQTDHINRMLTKLKAALERKKQFS